MAKNNHYWRSVFVFTMTCIFVGWGLYQLLNTVKEKVQGARDTTATKIERALKGAE